MKGSRRTKLAFVIITSGNPSECGGAVTSIFYESDNLGRATKITYGNNGHEVVYKYDNYTGALKSVGTPSNAELYVKYTSQGWKADVKTIKRIWKFR